MELFTSDLHLGHRKMLEYRGFQTLEEHDMHIIDTINRRAPGSEHTLYVLGDLSFHKPDVTGALLSMIRAKVVLIKGNHDHRKANKEGARLPGCVDIELSEFHHYLERTFTVEPEGPGQLICMFHFPMMHWHKQHYGSWQLHGHLHGNPSGVTGKILDVGWDAHNKPLTLMEVKAIMDTKPLRGNHHTEKH